MAARTTRGLVTMAYFYDELAFLEGCRRTALWVGPPSAARLGQEVVSGHLVALPEDQHVAVESDFLMSHLPFHVGGFGGVCDDGLPWLFVLQIGPAQPQSVRTPGDESCGDLHVALRRSLDRALALNPQARVTAELLWDRDRLLSIYDERGAERSLASLWDTADLLKGLLAECCDTPLPVIVAGHAGGCAFPGTAHACEADVFADVFVHRAGQYED